MTSSVPPSTLISTTAASLFEVRAIARTGTLYAILDACDAPAVPPMVTELGEDRAVSLYRGGAEEQLADIAPYLVAVSEALLDWILTTLWGEPWGVLLTSDADLGTLRTHFRKFLVVDAPTGEQWYFRFYDPRVLGAYCDSCNETELRNFFGPVQSFGVPDDASGVRWRKVATVQEAWAIAHPSVPPKPKIVFKMTPSIPPHPDRET